MYRCALPKGPVRSASRGSPAAKSIRLALRTSSIVATRRASFVRWVLRCFGRRRLSSSPKLPAISVMPSMMRFQVPPRPDPLNHTPIRHVNNLLLKLIYGKAEAFIFEESQEFKDRLEIVCRKLGTSYPDEMVNVRELAAFATSFDWN